jgi:hypothetical protein
MQIAHRRLYNQLIASASPRTPGDVVKEMGAVQAQDYAGALWAVGLRSSGAGAEDVEQALADKAIIRTWPMRGTLHFVAPEDVRWMLAYLTPRVLAKSRGRFQQLELDEATFERSAALARNALQGGERLTRDAMYEMLDRGGVATTGQRGIHILSWLAQKGILCFGPRRGKQQTFVLLEEWVPPAAVPSRDEALSELARRYFTSHGPATLRDFMWWSGLLKSEAVSAIETIRPKLVSEEFEGQSFWAGTTSSLSDAASTAQLLPVYDEYTVAYKDRSAALDPLHAEQTGNGIFRPAVIVDGRIVGTWRRTLKRDSVVVEIAVLRRLTRKERRAVSQSAKHYGDFIGKNALVEIMT